MEQNKNEITQLAVATLPRYRLLKRVRVHEFHRRPIPPPGSGFDIYFQGPIEINAGAEPNSAAFITFGSCGLQTHATGSGSINRKAGGSEADLVIIGDQLVDEFAGDQVGLETALEQYLAKVPDFLAMVIPAP